MTIFSSKSSLQRKQEVYRFHLKLEVQVWIRNYAPYDTSHALACLVRQEWEGRPALGLNILSSFLKICRRCRFCCRLTQSALCATPLDELTAVCEQIPLARTDTPIDSYFWISESIQWRRVMLSCLQRRSVFMSIVIRKQEKKEGEGTNVVHIE